MATGTEKRFADMVVEAESLSVGAAGSKVTITGTEIGYTDGVTAGTASASKALVVDSSINLAALNNLSMTGDLTVDGAVGTGTATAGVIKLTTPELTVVDNDQLGRIDFQAPLETGADAILVSASIWAEAEATFDATTNTTALVFATGTSEAAAEKTRIGGDGTLTHTASLATGANATDRVTIKGIYMSPSNVAVTVPAITDPDIAKVDVDVSAAFAIQPAVGDGVLAIPAEAMEANARILNAYVTNTDQITVVFGSEGGNVTGGAKNFKFIVLDVT